MNRFDEKYNIRFAQLDEIDNVMDFIDNYWKKDHILAKDRKFFEYEHVIDEQVNFLIAKDKETGEIHGILGFLPASRCKEKYDVWGVVWKVRADIAMPMLGIELKKRLIEYTGARAELGVGANPNTSVPLLRMLLHYHVAKMKHYYCLAEKKEYKIAKVEHYEPFEKNESYQVTVRELKNLTEVLENYNFENNQQVVPYKDAWYIDRRYFQHPVYEYKVYGLLENGSEIKALVVCREQEYSGEKVLRIVDYIGKQSLFGGMSDFFKQELLEYEYIDFYCYGFDENYVKQAGMREVYEGDTNIIPNYFAPYVQQNIDIWVDSFAENCLFFKADGDQDRPN